MCDILFKPNNSLCGDAECNAVESLLYDHRVLPPKASYLASHSKVFILHSLGMLIFVPHNGNRKVVHDMVHWFSAV